MRSALSRPGMTRLVVYWGPVILWMAVIFWMSSGMFSSSHTSRIIVPLLRNLFPALPEQDIFRYHDIIRKMAHMFEYFILGLLLFRAFGAGQGAPSLVRRTAYSFAAVVLYALSDEYHQSFDSERTASLVDVGFDAAGGLAALCLCVVFGRPAQKKSLDRPDGLQL